MDFQNNEFSRWGRNKKTGLHFPALVDQSALLVVILQPFARFSVEAVGMSFVLKMAWRDSRRNRVRLFLFVSAVVAGVAALTAVRSFSENLKRDIDREAKTLLSADLQLSSNHPVPDSLLNAAAGPDAVRAKVVSFISMVRFSEKGARLSQVRAIEGDYPFYGSWKTAPENADRRFRTGKLALAEHPLFLQFGLQPGDTAFVGNVAFRLEGDLLSSPGRAGIASAVAPVVLIPMQWLDSTGLVQLGSRINYQYFFKLPPGTDAAARIKPIEKQLDMAGVNWETVETRKAGIGTAFSNFSTFLNLVGFVSLLLGCIGVAGAVHLYIKAKLPTVAILRCLGASGRKAFLIYLVQIAVIGFLGALCGALLGSVVQKVLPWLMKDLLPINDVSTDFSPLAVLQGVLLGLSVSVLFALLPLSGILNTSPLRTLRADYGEGEEVSALWRWSIYLFLVLAVGCFTWWLVGDWQQTLGFLGGLAGAFLLLYLTARALMHLLRRFFPRNWSYVWRQGIANLFRPQNQTTLLVITVGLGAMLPATLFLMQSMLLRQLQFAGSTNRANVILFDIQTADRDSVAALVQQQAMPVLQQIPVVTVRIESVNGRTKQIDQADSTNAMPFWVWNNEFRVTFRDTLVGSEEVVKGKWLGEHTPGEPVKISIADGMERALRSGVGTHIVFNIQGTRLETEVASVRKVTFNQIQPTFMVLFPKGVLEAAPQIHVMVSRVSGPDQLASFQTALAKRYPTVSAIDLSQVLRSVDEVLSKVSFVIQFMSIFCILTGLLVLISSIYQNKFARIRESVLLRTLGASRRQILRINALEYLLLGALASLTGLLLALAGAWALAHFAFKIDFHPSWLPLLFTFVVISTLTLLIGLFNSREVVRKPPLEVLRTN